MIEKNNRKIAEHVFNGATTMTGVCVTIIALFKIMKGGIGTYADEILAADTCIFLTSAILAYAVLRTDDNKKLEKTADILFFTGMGLMMVVGMMIVYSTY